MMVCVLLPPRRPGLSLEHQEEMTLYWSQSLPTLMKHVPITLPSFPWLLAVSTDINTYPESWVLGATKDNHVRRLSALRKLP